MNLPIAPEITERYYCKVVRLQHRSAHSTFDRQPDVTRYHRCLKFVNIHRAFWARNDALSNIRPPSGMQLLKLLILQDKSSPEWTVLILEPLSFLPWYFTLWVSEMHSKIVSISSKLSRKAYQLLRSLLTSATSPSYCEPDTFFPSPSLSHEDRVIISTTKLGKMVRRQS